MLQWITGRNSVQAGQPAGYVMRPFIQGAGVGTGNMAFYSAFGDPPVAFGGSGDVIARSPGLPNSQIIDTVNMGPTDLRGDGAVSFMQMTRQPLVDYRKRGG